MPVQVTKNTASPVLVVKFFEPFDIKTDVDQMFDDMQHFMQEANKTPYMVIDISGIELRFSDAIMAMSKSLRSDYQLNDEDGNRLFQPILVGSGKLIDLVANAFKQDQYGNLNTPVFNNFEEAIAFAESQLA